MPQRNSPGFYQKKLFTELSHYSYFWYCYLLLKTPSNNSNKSMSNYLFFKKAPTLFDREEQCEKMLRGPRKESGTSNSYNDTKNGSEESRTNSQRPGFNREILLKLLFDNVQRRRHVFLFIFLSKISEHSSVHVL
jgi:hypothetical protein